MAENISTEKKASDRGEERMGALVKRMRSQGQRVTPQRLALVRAFLAHEDHPSAEMLHRELREKFPTMALSTVYNTLHLLKELGAAVEVSPTTVETRYDPDTGDHCHLVCVECHRLIDLPLEACVHERGLQELAEEHHFTPVRQVHQIYGHCADCTAQSS
jgi:Fur family peroxide stress response transcriptional regulator